jgi:hypothetical protein
MLISQAQTSNQILFVWPYSLVQPEASTEESTTTSTSTPTNASKALLRISQADVSQYANSQEHATWWASSCSATSMAVVLNSYGHRYRITDILKIESSLGAISPKNGLLYGNGIDTTAARFGFETRTLNKPSLDQVIDTANKGQPVIVSFPPQPDWTGGHILVVRGGNSTTVKLADSSNYNLETVTRHYFTTHWRGFAKVLTPSKYTIAGKPTTTVTAINALLERHHSPVSGQGQMIYDKSIKYHLDPAVIMGFFGHESTFGTQGMAVESKSAGNLRCIREARCERGYAFFNTWEEGFEAMCRLLASDLYVKDSRIIPETIIPRYAPSADNNNEQGYIQALKHIIDVLRTGGTTL